MPTFKFHAMIFVSFLACNDVWFFLQTLECIGRNINHFSTFPEYSFSHPLHTSITGHLFITISVDDYSIFTKPYSMLTETECPLGMQLSAECSHLACEAHFLPLITTGSFEQKCLLSGA